MMPLAGSIRRTICWPWTTPSAGSAWKAKLVELPFFAGMDSRLVLARFDANRQALAMMDHPNIAGVYDGAATEANQPFFVMELIHGVPITDYRDRHRLSVDAHDGHGLIGPKSRQIRGDRHDGL